MSHRLRVAIIAPPWLALPIKGYGGIELVLQSLIEGLKKQDIDIVVYGNGASKMKGVEIRSLYKEEQYKYIHLPMFDILPVFSAHMQFALSDIERDGKFDVIHDHNGFLGPQLLAWATGMNSNIPPAIHTDHGPPFSTEQMIQQGLPDNNLYFEQLAEYMGRTYIVGISDALMALAPEKMKSHILPTVYNAITIENFPFIDKKKNYFITLARFNRDKAQHVAAKLCAKKGYRLRMAGTVAGIESPRKLLLELANPLSSYRNAADFRYYSDNILSYVLRNRKITFSGNLSGLKKNKFMSEAKALLFPIDWEEPFGMAVIEALACGTPVVAMNRGAMPEIIQHGVNGFLANNEEEFADYMERVAEISPEDCRKSVEEKFSGDVMAAAYVERYKYVVKKG